MKHLATYSYAFLAIGVCLACGGNVEHHEPTAKVGGSSSVGGVTATAVSAAGGGQSRGGSQSKGGSVARGGGQAFGGMDATGGSSPGASSSGTATGALPARCLEPKDSGPCEAAIVSYWHDPAIGVCVPFIYGGCAGNSNRFESESACQAACHGAPSGVAELDRCNNSSECTLESVSCCAQCEPVSNDDFVAIRRDAAASYRNYHQCNNVMCEQCLPTTLYESRRQNYYAVCEAGQCAVRDIRTTALTECKTADDCVLRGGTSCCESCGDSDWVSLRKDADTFDAFCGGVGMPCPAILCSAPAGYSADCDDKGRCVVRGAAVCTFGRDQTCNDNLIMSSIAGTCNEDGTCTCNEGRTLVASSGRCL